MKFLASHMVEYTIKPLMRNKKLYQLSIYRKKRGNNKLVYHLRDSYTQLPNSLETLAKTLCPHLGSKGSIAHDEVQVSSLQENRAQLLDYMELDISLLGGVLLFYFPRHSSTIESRGTLQPLLVLSSGSPAYCTLLSYSGFV
jgi:hypothetical protein